jgi:hypothetical protein
MEGNMTLWRRIFRFLKWPLILLLQMLMIVMILAILPIFPDLIPYLEEHPLAMLAFVGAVFAFGSFQIGWLGVHFGWLSKGPKMLVRLTAALLGAYIPLDLGLLIDPYTESGNLSSLIALFTSAAAFHLPEWVKAYQNQKN